VRPFLLGLMLLTACAPDTPEAHDDPVVEPDADPEPVHPCDAEAEARFDAGDPWTPQQKQSCFDGCEAGDLQGFEQGRLACILDDEPCPECVADQSDPAYDVGYKACYAESYEEGYADEGCETL